MTDNKVVALPGVTIKPSDGPAADETVVETLEYVLERAKRGEVKWVGLAWVDERNIGHSQYAPGLDEGDVASLLTSAMGSVSYLDHRLASSALDGHTHVSDAPADDED